MTLSYKEFIITGTVDEIMEIINQIEQTGTPITIQTGVGVEPIPNDIVLPCDPLGDRILTTDPNRFTGRSCTLCCHYHKGECDISQELKKKGADKCEWYTPLSLCTNPKGE